MFKNGRIFQWITYGLLCFFITAMLLVAARAQTFPSGKTRQDTTAMQELRNPAKTAEQ